MNAEITSDRDAGNRTPAAVDDTLRRIRHNLTAIVKEVAEACKRVRRDFDDVTILPVTKYVEPELVRLLVKAGLQRIGESTVQEAVRKREALADALGGAGPIRWHLVGHLQRNKVNRALEIFDVIHSLDSFRLAEAIDRRVPASSRPAPRLFVEVNVAGESSKGGVAPGDVLDLLGRIHDETSLGPSLEGLMTIGPPDVDPEETRRHFANLRELRDTAIRAELLPESAGLSMGMSDDFALAVEEGATIVRIGSRLFEGLPRRSRK